MKSRPGQEEPPEGARRTPFLQPLPSSREVILQFRKLVAKGGRREKEGWCARALQRSPGDSSGWGEALTASP